MIGIIGAMEEEVQALKEAMTIEETREKASMTFCRGTLQGREVVVVRSGVGKVNAGICAQILIDDFGADTLINTGIAGSLDARIDIGDIVISTEALHHDMDASIFGDPVGQVPRMDVLAFPADPDLAKKARQANEAANPDIHTFLGRVVSGDQFISSHEAKERISSLFHPLSQMASQSSCLSSPCTGCLPRGRCWTTCSGLALCTSAPTFPWRCG